MSEQLQRGLSHEEQSLSSPSADRLRAWRLYFESALALIDVLDAELERDAGIPLRSCDALVHLEETPDGLRMNELAERILYSKSGFTRVVDRLEDAGLVRRVRPEGDRRSSSSSSPTRAARRWSTHDATTDTRSSNTSPATSRTPISRLLPAHSKSSARTPGHFAPDAYAASATGQRASWRAERRSLRSPKARPRRRTELAETRPR